MESEAENRIFLDLISFLNRGKDFTLKTYLHQLKF